MILKQVNRILSKRQALTLFFRASHGETFALDNVVLHPLERRKILRISGNDASVFLQGLITNDMRHFEEGAKSMYAMLLNNKGRVLYDTLIHKWEDEDTFLIECDKDIFVLLQKHLKLYKLRRQFDIKDVNHQLKVWALISPVAYVPDTKIDPKSDINIFKDPRLTELGYRIIAAASLEGHDIAKTIDNNILVKPNDNEYKYLRYMLGVSEGAEDLPPGSHFPLEVNCDYLHGVSFHKGCYIGQELTARVHHTGVVRKRIMPLKFSKPVDEDLEKDMIITATNKPKSNLGKLKGYIKLKDYGIGLVRVKEALDADALNIGKHVIEVTKPSWWPIEAPKEKTTVKIE